MRPLFIAVFALGKIVDNHFASDLFGTLRGLICHNATIAIMILATPKQQVLIHLVELDAAGLGHAAVLVSGLPQLPRNARLGDAAVAVGHGSAGGGLPQPQVLPGGSRQRRVLCVPPRHIGGNGGAQPVGCKPQ